MLNRFVALISAGALVLLTACGSIVPGAGGGAAPALKDIPVFTGATELQPGKSAIADTLVRNAQKDAQVRQAANVGGKTEQKAYNVPAGTTFQNITGFYDDKLKGLGFTSGSAAASAAGVDVNKVLAAASVPGAPQVNVYSKGSNSFTVMFMQDPTTNESIILVSLSTT